MFSKIYIIAIFYVFISSSESETNINISDANMTSQIKQDTKMKEMTQSKRQKRKQRTQAVLDNILQKKAIFEKKTDKQDDAGIFSDVQSSIDSGSDFLMYLLSKGEKQSKEMELTFEEVLKLLDTNKIDYEQVRNYANSMVDVLSICKFTWFTFSTPLNSSKRTSESHSDHGEALFGKASDFSFGELQFQITNIEDIKQKIFTYGYTVSTLAKYISKESYEASKYSKFNYFISEYWVRSELCREMLISEYRSLFHFKMRCLTVNLLLRECNAHIISLVEDKLRIGNDDSLILHLNALVKQNDYLLVNVIPFIDKTCAQAFAKIEKNFKKTGFNFEKCYEQSRSKLEGIIDFSMNISFSEIITLMKKRNFENLTVEEMLQFVSSDFFQYAIFSGAKKILNVLTNELVLHLTPLCNLLEILIEYSHEKTLPSNESMQGECEDSYI